MQEQKPKRKISFLFTIIMCIIVGVAEFFILKGGYLGYSIVKNNRLRRTRKSLFSRRQR